MTDLEILTDAVGKTRGHFSKKENRARKLLAEWDSLQAKLEAMVIRGNGITENARLAYAVLLMMETGIRVGNEGSAEGFVCENKHHESFGQTVQTYGLTTLLQSHIKRKRGSLVISFVGKKLVAQELVVKSEVLIGYAPSTDKPSELWIGIDYYSLVKFCKRYVGKGYSPKDIRTARVNQLFIAKFAPKVSEYLEVTRKSDRKKMVSATIEETANVVGHTKSVCKSAYLSSPLLRMIADSELHPEKWKR